MRRLGCGGAALGRIGALLDWTLGVVTASFGTPLPAGLVERLAPGRLRRAGFVARTVAIKVRFSDFTTITRSRTLASPTDVGKELYDTSRMLYEALGLQRARIRLVGVKAEGLIPVDEAPGT